MLRKYFNHIKESMGDFKMIKPEPPGFKKVLTNKISYHKKFNDKVKAALDNIYKKTTEEIVEDMKKDIKDRFISLRNANGHTKFILVNDISIEKIGDIYYPVLIENKDRKSICLLNNDAESKIFFLDDYLTFFEKNYLDKVIGFTGKSIKSGRGDTNLIKHIIRVGIRHTTTNDQILIDDIDNNRYALNFNNPIKLYDDKIKEIDPYGEENWDE